MKIKSITIENMHNVAKKTYTFKEITYLVGRNGAGKSTVLEAIQLALLGYIPGYGKTNQDIFKHASNRVMGVKLTLDNDGKDVVIDRTWIGGASVKSELVVTPVGYDISSVLKDIELPIFNFNDFKDMTANKLKEWFISFLPNSGDDLDWGATLKGALSTEPIDQNLVANELAVIAELKKTLTGVELVKAVNTHFKDLESFLKGQVASYKGAIDSLVHYDDIPADASSEEIKHQISELYDLKNKLDRADVLADSYNRAKDAFNTQKIAVDAMKSECSAEEAAAKIDEANSTMEKNESEYRDLEAEFVDLSAERKKLELIVKGGDVCPYTNSPCESITDMVSKAQKELKRLEPKLDAISKEGDVIKSIIDSSRKVASKYSDHLMKLDSAIKMLDQRSAELKIVEDQMTYAVPPTDMTKAEIVDKISELNDDLSKAIANEKYNEMMQNVTADKFKAEDSLEIVKVWDKLTGANGLQTQMMEKPFTDLADDMTEKLTSMFGKSTVAKFNLSEKANSFSFGVIREDSYIPFEVLSSGEKCLYTLAMMLCIMDRSKTDLRLVIIDDLLDHLDSDNMKFTFTSLLKLSKDIQIILAGVQPCDIKEIEVSVEA